MPDLSPTLSPPERQRRQRPPRARRAINRHIFERVHGSQLIYNTCWEDPRLDRAAMALDRSARVLMITSAGCNALDYLLDDPARIDCVDLNPRQNALLELKIAGLRTLDQPDFAQLFRQGWHIGFDRLYRTRLRPALSRRAQEIWDRDGGAFLPTTRRRSFYYHGTCGAVAWGVTRMLHARPEVRQAVQDLLRSRTLEAQRHHFAIVEAALWNGAFRWFCSRTAALSLIGVPEAQRRLVEESGGMVDYMRACLRKVFCTLPVSDNYFWRVYLTGSYSRSCCPAYLEESAFDVLRDRVDRVRVHTDSLTEYMRGSGLDWSHFVLLDHQDWLAHEAPEALAEEWRHLLAHGTADAAWLLRTGGSHIDFIPDFVREQVRFVREDALHALDRVGTYGSFHVGRRHAAASRPASC